MIVVEGMPGAGKTTVLGGLLAAAPSRLVVFPEAQPAEAGGGVLAGLLDDDAERLALADRLAARGLACAGDRCYVGTLAYRYARTRTGLGDPGEPAAALAEVDRRGLRARHACTTLLVLHLPPAASLDRRRTTTADVRARFTEWFDPAFLAAYAAFLARPDWWAPPGATVHHVEATELDAVRAALAAATGVTPAPHTGGRALDCPGTCGTPRSPVVRLRGADVQLAARGLHHRPPGGPVACLRRPADVAACWTG